MIATPIVVLLFWLAPRPLNMKLRASSIWLACGVLASGALALPIHSNAPPLGGPLPSAEIAFVGLPGYLQLISTTLLPTVAVTGFVLWVKTYSKSGFLMDGVFIRRICLFLFAGYLVGTTGIWFFLPISFLLSFAAYFGLLLEERSACEIRDRVAETVRDDQELLVRKRLECETALGLRASLVALADKVATGDLSIADYSTQRRAVEGYVTSAMKEEDLRGSDGAPEPHVKGSDLAFSVTKERPAEAAQSAMNIAIVPAVAFAGVAAASTILNSSFVQDPFPQVELAGGIVATLGYWLIGAYTFGLLFTYVRGRSGMTKGLRFAATLALVNLPLQLLSLHSLPGVGTLLLSIGETVGFYALLGLWFDYEAFARAQGRE